MPERIVWPVSSSSRNWQVGSSAASAFIDSTSLSLSAELFGSIAMNITGCGAVMRSK